jgi:hypothetical protein
MAHQIMSSGRIRLALRAPEGEQDQDQDNPFAPPPEGTPDRPWQPRDPADGAPPPPPPGGPQQQWGSQWSTRQPPGHTPQGPGPHPTRSPGGPSGPQGTGPRFDPTDPAHRRSRYAMLCGFFGLAVVLLGWIPVGLLLGALSLYWGVSALRMSPQDRAQARAAAASALADATQSTRPAPPAPGPDAQRSFMTAAWTGIVTAGVTLAIVASSYALHLAYHDYYTCKRDALTTPASEACQKLLPEPLRSVPAMRP